MNDIIDGGDALFAVAAEITGASSLERANYEVGQGIKGRTFALHGKLVTAIDARADARFDAKIEAALRYWMPIVGGTLTVRADVAPVVREIRGEVGDRFERTGESCTGCVFEVVEVWESGTRSLTSSGTGHQWRADIGMLRDPSLFRFISSAAERAAALVAIADAGEAPAEMAVAGVDVDTTVDFEIGDRFECIAGLRKGRTGMVYTIDADGDAWIGFESGGNYCAMADELTDASRWIRLPSKHESDAAPVGGLTAAGQLLFDMSDAAQNLIRVWHAYGKDRETEADTVQDALTVLAKCAGLPVPWLQR